MKYGKLTSCSGIFNYGSHSDSITAIYSAFLQEYGINPSLISDFYVDGAKTWKFLAKSYYLSSSSTRNGAKKHVFRHSKFPVWAILSVSDTSDRGATLCVIYDVSNESARKIKASFVKMSKTVKDAPKMNFLCQEGSSLTLKEVEIPCPEFDLSLNYGASFLEFDKHVMNCLVEQRDYSGLILLHGKPGTGKTHYIRHLVKSTHPRKMIYIPPHMANAMSEPSFLAFMLNNTGAILLIEDAEVILRDRKFGGGAVSNLLNLTDGMLADALKCQVICTFNIEREEVDKALLRNGRLLAEHYFNPLCEHDANRLLASLSKQEIATGPMSLADIYNKDVPRADVPEPKRMGFAA